MHTAIGGIGILKRSAAASLRILLSLLGGSKKIVAYQQGGAKSVFFSCHPLHSRALCDQKLGWHATSLKVVDELDLMK